MTNANIIIPEANRIEIIDKPVPEPKPGEVRVRLVRSTISSGTERANYVGEVNVNILTNDGVARWPRQGGYSSSGVVDAVGDGVTSLKPGDRVAMSWTVHSQYVVVPEENAYLLPDNVSFEAGALAHIATFPMAAVRKCGVELGESAVVMGQGVLGQLAVMLLKCAGAAPVFAADPVPEKRERALKLGADYAMKQRPDIFFAGQITGVEGYMESAASGILAGKAAAARVLNRDFTPLPKETMIGALIDHVAHCMTQPFEPMGANFGIIPPLETPIREKKERYAALSARALAVLDQRIREGNI